MTKALSDSHIRHFNEVGFLKVKDVVPADLRGEAKGQLEEDLRKPAGPFHRNAKGDVYKIYGLLERGGAYEKIIRLPSLLNLVEDLVGPDIVYTRNRHNHGSLNHAGDNDVRLHRDILRVGYISVIVYLEQVTLERGPTFVVPTSHRWPYSPDSEGGIFLDQIEHPSYVNLGDQAVPILADAGDVLLFEGILFHTAARNSTAQSRAALVLGYRAVDELNGVLDQAECLVRGRDLYRGNVVLPRV